MLSGINRYIARAAACALLAAAAVTVSCDKVPLLAPTGSTVTLTSPTRSLPINGTTQVTALVVESSGTTVQNGTSVFFSTTLGTVSPASVLTTNGVATATFNAGNASGTAAITAISGPGGTTSGTTPPTNATNTIQITIGAANAGRINLVANPQSVPSNGGTSLITATVFDTGGNPLPDVPVSFTTDAGSLSQSTATTDAAGNASVTLTTNRQAKVTARVSSGTNAPSADVTVNVNVQGTVSLTCLGVTGGTAGATCTQILGLPVTFTAQRGTTTGAAPITSSTINFGDGTSAALGNLSSTVTVPHTYTNAGSFTATLAAVDANGETTTAAAVVTITPQVPIGVNITVTQGTGTSLRVFTFAAAVSPASAADLVQSYTWDFGDGTTATTTGNTTTHIYNSAGARTISVIVKTVDNRTGTGSTQILVP